MKHIQSEKNNMGEFIFYINDKQRADIIGYILEKKTSIIVDEMYPTKEVNIIKSVHDFNISMNKGQCKFFLLNDLYTTEPIINSRNRYSKEPVYSIEQRKGGPYIDLFFYLGYSEDEIIPYKRSVIDYYSRFIHFDSYSEFPAPTELKLFFKDIINVIKKVCTSVKKKERKIWLSKEVLTVIGSEGSG